MQLNRRRAFTLIELLVVVAIIGLLISILLPSLSRAREQAKVAKCLGNLRAIGIAAATYTAEDKSRDFPWAIHTYYQADGKIWNWSYYTEFIWGGGMPVFEWVNVNWPYPKGKPTFADVLKLEPRYRPLNKYMSNEVSWNRFHAMKSQDPTPFEESLPSTFICPSDSTCAVPDVGEAEKDAAEDFALPTWKFYGSSYPINWYWGYYYNDNATGGTGKKAEQGKVPPYSTGGILTVLGAGGTGSGTSFKNHRGLGSRMLGRNAAGGWESRFIVFYENRVNEALEAARPRDKDGKAILKEGKNLIGWHKQKDKHSVLMLDGHAEYRTMDTRFIDGSGWTTWPNRPWLDDWAPYTEY